MISAPPRDTIERARHGFRRALIRGRRRFAHARAAFGFRWREESFAAASSRDASNRNRIYAGPDDERHAIISESPPESLIGR